MELVPLDEEQKPYFRWLQNPALIAITEALAAEGADGAPVCMYVGGAVRDSLRGHPPLVEEEGTDIDLATILTPDVVTGRLEKAGIKAIPTGIDHGTITAVKDGQVVEITSLRADVATDGRHATVQFTSNWDEDWRRRDFSVNALYVTPDGRLFDPAGGQAALKRQEVIFIGDATTRIREDYLRILRFYRFSARLARLPFDAAGRAACKAEAEGLSQISRERIGHEFSRILVGPSASDTLQLMQDDGVLQHIHAQPPDIEALRLLMSLSAGLHTPSVSLMLAALWPAAGAALDKGLRLSNRQAEARQAALAAAPQFAFPPGEAEARALLYRLGEEAFLNGLLLGWVKSFREAKLSPALERCWHQALSLPGRWQVPTFPLSGKHIEQAGIKPGPALGRALQAAEDKWIEAGFPDTEEVLQEILQEAVSSAS